MKKFDDSDFLLFDYGRETLIQVPYQACCSNNSDCLSAEDAEDAHLDVAGGLDWRCLVKASFKRGRNTMDGRNYRLVKNFRCARLNSG